MPLNGQDFVEDGTAVERLGGADRAAAVREIADALAASAVGLEPAELRVYDEVIRWLTRRSDGPVRAAVAAGVATAGSGAELTARDLARDPDPAVAGPVLRGSRLLADPDLIAVALTRGEAHLHAIAERAELAEPVTDAVAARGLRPVLQVLAANRGAHLSADGLDLIAAAARSDADLAAALLKRGDLPVRLTQDLLRTLASLRGPARLRVEAAPPRPEPAARPAAATRAPRVVPTGRELRRADAQAAALGRHLLLTGEDLLWCLDNERWVEGIAVVARLAGHPVEHVAGAFVERAAGAILALLFLAGARWEVAERALRAWDVPWSPDFATSYAGLTRPRAECVFRGSGFDGPLAGGRA